MELGAQIPISGRNLPTGSGVSVGYLMPWGHALTGFRRPTVSIILKA
jgi:hypothetical protein